MSRASAPPDTYPAAAHADAVRVLQSWSAPDSRQRALQSEFLAVLQADDLAVARTAPTHLTVGCLVLDATGTWVLLTHHDKAQRWLQLGGHIEPEDGVLRAAAGREALEESGLAGLTLSADPVDLDRHRLGTRFGTCREHLDVRYAALAPPEAAPIVSRESTNLRWWPVRSLPPGPDGRESDLLKVVAAAQRAFQIPGPAPLTTRRQAAGPRVFGMPLSMLGGTGHLDGPDEPDVP